MRLETLGRSAQGRALYAIRLTDPQTNDADKEHALITALHSGLERSGSNTVLSIIEWLLSDEPVAREILRRQVVVACRSPTPTATRRARDFRSTTPGPSTARATRTVRPRPWPSSA